MKKNSQTNQKLSEIKYDDDQQQGQQSLTYSLQFLQSLATTDPHTLLFGGNNASTLVDMDRNNLTTNSDSRSENQIKCFSLVLEAEEAFTSPPTATAVTKQGQPLILDFHSPPKSIKTHIWTDGSGALIPLSMYQKDIKKDRKPLHCDRTDQTHEEVSTSKMTPF